MDKSIIQEFARLRVLTPYQKTMDKLVHDLTNALEESSKAAAKMAAKSATSMVGTGIVDNSPAAGHSYSKHDSVSHVGAAAKNVKRRGRNRKRHPNVCPSSSSTILKFMSPRIKGLLSPTRLSTCTSADASNSLLLDACSEDSVSSFDESGALKSNPSVIDNIALGIRQPHSDSDCCNGPSCGGSNVCSRPIAFTRILAMQQGKASGRNAMSATSAIPTTVGSFAESDSVNENFSPVRPHRRKRKFKRMAVDPATTGLDPIVIASGSTSPVQFFGHRSQRRMVTTSRSCASALVEGECSCNFVDTDLIRSPVPTSGKRKHSMRERSLELMEAAARDDDDDDVGNNDALLEAERCLESVVISDLDNEVGQSMLHLVGVDHHHNSATMDVLEEGGSSSGATCVIVDSAESYTTTSSSSSEELSGSESDAGIYTNDEGREGDDEQSDFYHEGELADRPGSVCGVPGIIPWWERDPIEDEEDETFRSILTRHMSVEARHAFDDRIASNVGICGQLTQMHGREIRAGRRRLRDRRPGFSIISSMNERISKFLQNPDQNELRLCPMKKKEMNQLGHLASLYSLSMRSDRFNQDKCPILTKTRNTTQVVNLDKIAVNGLWNGGKRWAVANAIKRCRRTPPICPDDDLPNEPRAPEPIPEHNFGNQLLLDMGWEPSQGSILDKDCLKMPIHTQMRPRHVGHGLGSSAASSKTSNNR